MNGHLNDSTTPRYPYHNGRWRRWRPIFQLSVAWISGAFFAAGLALSGMTRTEKVQGFLDLFGEWDPSLAFVMAGAIAVHLVASRWILRRRSPLLDVSFRLPTSQRIEPKLLLGAALFGVGWGLIGFCPGPALVSLGSGHSVAWIFVFSMLIGMLMHALLGRSSRATS